MQVWISAKAAKEMGCTHRARYLGVIPGFYGPDRNLWVSRSDLLNPIEDLLSFIWVWLREWRGEDPDFMFEVGAAL